MSTDPFTQFRHIMAENGHRLTAAREATFRLLLDTEPLSMREVLARSEGQPDRVSIYRSIELFEQLGIVQRIYIGWKYKLELSDEFVAHHHHLSCLQCGRIIDIHDEEHIDEFIQAMAAQYGFAPRRHQFEVDGYCSECQKLQA